MNKKFRFVALYTALSYMAAMFAGCSNKGPLYSEDGVVVGAGPLQEGPAIDSDRVAVVGQIQILENNGKIIDPSSELVVYILRDIPGQNHSIPDWSVDVLAHLQSKPFTSDKDGYFRITLPRGKYYPQFIYRKMDLAVFAINPHIRLDISEVLNTAYIGKLTLTVDAQRLDQLRVTGASKDQIVGDAASLLIEDNFNRDHQQLARQLNITSEDVVSQTLFVADPGTVPTVLTSDAILTKEQKVARVGKILMTTGALILLLPLMVIGGAAGGNVSFK